MVYRLAGHDGPGAATHGDGLALQARFAPRSFRLDMTSNRSSMLGRTNLILLAFGILPTLWLRFSEERRPVAQCLGLAERREVASIIQRALGAWRP
jgi:hypothetical protein